MGVGQEIKVAAQDVGFGARFYEVKDILRLLQPIWRVVFALAIPQAVDIIDGKILAITVKGEIGHIAGKIRERLLGLPGILIAVDKGVSRLFDGKGLAAEDG